MDYSVTTEATNSRKRRPNRRLQPPKSTIGRVINIGTGKPTTIKQLAEIVMNAANNEAPLEYRPRPKGDPFGGYAETTQMKKLLEWKPKTPLKNGIKRHYNWINHNKNIIPQWM